MLATMPPKASSAASGCSVARFLQVVRRESCVLCDSREHAGAQLLAIMKGEHIVRPTRPREGSVGTRLALDRPANTLKRG
jgi:hypothetical protein